jgi:hypothetical protein
VAVTTVPGSTRLAQIAPPAGAISSLQPAPGAPRAQIVAAASGVPSAAPPAGETPESNADWHALVTSGDALMAQRQRDEALDAYLNAFDLATDGRPIAPSEVAQLCRKLANFQMSFGNQADARQTLERGRQTLKRMVGGKDGADRQKYIEQIENTLRSLPRD